MQSWHIALFTLSVTAALPIGADPAITAPTPELCVLAGYPTESHVAETQDGYLLTVHRIPRPGSPAVLLHHGLEDASHSWVINSATESLGFILYDAGFDVWMGNARGNTYSMAHKTLAPKDKAFWDFSFDDIAKFDLPAQLDLVRSSTKQDKIGYLGHSQGTMMGFIGFTDPAIAAKVTTFIALAPVAYVEHISSLLIQAMAKLHAENLLKLLGMKDFGVPKWVLDDLLPGICKVSPDVCESTMCLIMGCDKSDWNATRFSVYTGHDPAGTSVKNMVHFSQAVRDGTWGMFDYGEKGNLEHYNQTSPPRYDLSKLQVNVSLFTGGKDALADPQDVARMLTELPADHVQFHHDEPSYSHLDFIWGVNAHTKIYPDVTRIFTDAAPSTNTMPHPPGPAAEKRSNILFMMADQMRHDAMSSVRRGPKTPSLDRIASEGVLFSRAYSATPTCTPARAAILTGQRPWNHGMLGYGVVAPRYPFELPRAMAAAGYQTASIGKDKGVSHGYSSTDLYDGLVTEPDEYHTWFQRQKPGVKPESGWPTLDMNSWKGAAYVYNESMHPTAWVGQAAVDYIMNYNDSKPFFLKVSFHRPHSPYDPPQRLLDATTDQDTGPVVLSKDGWDDRFSGSGDAPPGCGPASLDAWCGAMPHDEMMLGRRAYLANIAFVDEWVGKIYAALEVVACMCHRDMWQGDHHHWRKGYPYELSAHVPFLLRPPSSAQRVVRGGVVDDLVELRDIFPTCLDVAGVSPPHGHTIDGSSLLCHLDKEGCGSWREWLDLEHTTCYNETNHWSAATDGEIKYIFNAFFPQEQMFNLTADPTETVDVASDPAYAHQLATFRARLVSMYQAEGRGTDWVKDGQLVQRIKPQTYSPNYPGDHRAVPQDTP